MVHPVIATGFYYPYYYPYYYPFFWGAYGWWQPGPWPGYYGRGYQLDSSARLQVTPRETEVYVDGYFVGTVDDFDGFSQRLRVPAGEHLIELYLDGHQLISQSVLFQPGETYRMRHTMQPLASGEAAPPKPTPRALPSTRVPPDPYDALGRRIPPDRQGPSAPGGPAQTAGTLSIRVQPADAVVLIDGERWEGSSVGARLDVQVAPGPHRVEVQKEGYQPFSTSVTVRPGDTLPLNVSLTPRPPQEYSLW